jgi:hypothetical protein
MKTKQQAQNKGKALLRKMKGKGWKLRIWENLGWHYEVSLGGLTVSPFEISGKKERYHALLSAGDYAGTGEIFWTDVGFYSTDPNKVVKHQLKIARDFINKCNKAIKQIEQGGIK